MASPPSAVSELLIPLDPRSAVPLHRQLYEGVRSAIVTGRLAAGVRIPSSRALATALAVSRSTVLVAFEQLVAEGYLQGRAGSGSHVASQIPDHLLRTGTASTSPKEASSQPPRLAARMTGLGTLSRGMTFLGPGSRPFRPGVPPLDQFPIRIWSRLLSRRAHHLSQNDLAHGAAAGYLPLREAVASYLTAARGMRCEAGQILILSSAQEALELACRVLLDPGDPAWMEDPGWVGARGALIAAGARIINVPVDEDGLVVDRGIAAEPAARVAYVSPSHQYPAGVRLSLERRLTLLQWAAKAGAWILEDDYDSEFRYAGHPLTALCGLDPAERVLYVGTFNKTLYPSLRIGYLVLPPALVDGFLAARRVGAQHTATLEQAVLTDFILEGHYGRHLRRARGICCERRDTLLSAARRELSEWLTLAPADTGLHLLASLDPQLSDTEISARAARYGVEALPFSAFHVTAPARQGLVLGYAGYAPGAIRAAVRSLAEALTESPRSR